MEIKARDLVMVVKPRICCPERTKWGATREVLQTKIKGGDDIYMRCPFCKNIYTYVGHASMLAKDSWVESYRLKKIDPPSTGELDRVPVRIKEPV